MRAGDRVATWVSWLDKESMPEGWTRNLWDEFYAFQHRRHQWNAYMDMLGASAADAQRSARWLTQVSLRNYVEAQCAGIRRFASVTRDPRPVSFGKILEGIAADPQTLGTDHAVEARDDLAELRRRVEGVDAFVNKVVAHLDQDAADVPSVTLIDMDEAIDFLTELWGRWFERVTGKGVDPHSIPETGWASFLRLIRI